MEKIVESFELYGKTYRFETGELAKQATGAVLVTQGETTVLVTAVISKEEKNYDFFPLTVDFMEKMYSVGRIPGGYLKREARPSEKGTQARGAYRCHHARVRRQERSRLHLRRRRFGSPYDRQCPVRRPCGLRAHRP